jgi:prepilin-type processing-associated H-X9-DG protein
MRGFFFSPSLEGGLELLELSSSRRRRSSAFSASSASIRRSSAATSSSTSGGRLIPPLSQKSTALSQKIAMPQTIERRMRLSGLTPAWQFRRLGKWHHKRLKRFDSDSEMMVWTAPPKWGLSAKAAALGPQREDRPLISLESPIGIRKPHAFRGWDRGGCNVNWVDGSVQAGQPYRVGLQVPLGVGDEVSLPRPRRGCGTAMPGLAARDGKRA